MSGEQGKHPQLLRSQLLRRHLLMPSQRTRWVGSSQETNQPVVFRIQKKLKCISASIHHLILLYCLINQIDWGDFGKSSGSQDTASAIKVEDEIDWGISLEPATEVKATPIWFIHCVSHPFSTFDKQMNKCRSDPFSWVYFFKSRTQ